MNESYPILITFILIFFCCINSDRNDKIQNQASSQRFGRLIKVRPEYEERYIILHKYTFQGVLDRICNSNLRNYSIFLKEGLLFAYYEYIGNNFEADINNIAKDTTTQDWWKLTKPMLEMLETRKEGEWWASMEELFHMDIIRKPSRIARRHAYTIDLDSKHQEEFKNTLNNFDLSINEQLHGANVQNISMYLKDGRLYCYFEYTGEDFQTDINKFIRTPEFENWRRSSEPFLQKIPNAKPDELWSEMKEVFHTD